jgi:Cft2 family RNA processing exonuclease
MFHFDRGLWLTRPGLAIDCCRRQPRAFISHAHIDHMARHEYALCTPGTARLYHLRLGARRSVLEMPYREPLDWGGLRLTTFPAGHCLGSAMLLAEDDGRSLLYTGDFKLEPSATAERADPPRADILVMESTYGDPRYRFTSRDETIERLLTIVHEAIRLGKTPVVHAYTLGKAQEVTRLLTAAGVRVLQHADVFAVSQVYEACGVPLGDYALLRGSAPVGVAIVAPPRLHRPGGMPDGPNQVRIAVTGWALDEATLRRWGVEHAVPLSDHADFAQLLETVERVGPSEIYCTHGPEGFVDELRQRGHNAQLLGKPKGGS